MHAASSSRSASLSDRGELVLIAAGAVLAAASWAVAALTLPVLERHAHAADLVDRPGGRKQHEGALPLAGGIAVLAAVAIPAVLGLVVALAAEARSLPLPDAVARHLPGIRTRAPQLLAVLGCAAALQVLGHLDDRRGLSPWLRLAVEAGCAAVLCALGVRLTAFLPWEAAHWALTIVFVVFLTNAVNFIDNMNGLMGGVVLIASLHLLALAISNGHLFLAAILVCLAGGLLAFLPRNFPKARVIMGDAGSLPLGFLLAAVTILFTFAQAPVALGEKLRPLALPLLILAVPIADGVTVIVARLRRGVHPFTAGRDHLSHRLVRRGLSPRGAVLALWGAGFAAGLVPVLALCSWPVVAAVYGAAAVPAALLIRWRAAG